MSCAEHGHIYFGDSATHAPIYVAAGASRCHVSISRTAADQLVRALVVARLGAHDAAALLRPAHDHASTETEINELRRRRDELAQLLSEGLLTGVEARPRLAKLADRLAELHDSRMPSTLAPAEAMRPEDLWKSWTTPQRREVARLLFARITLQHVGRRNGPRVDPTRVKLEWALS